MLLQYNFSSEVLTSRTGKGRGRGSSSCEYKPALDKELIVCFRKLSFPVCKFDNTDKLGHFRSNNNKSQKLLKVVQTYLNNLFSRNFWKTDMKRVDIRCIHQVIGHYRVFQILYMPRPNLQ